MSPPVFINQLGETNMTMRTTNGKTLSRQIQDEKNNFDYRLKLTNNTIPTLNRLGNVATVELPTEMPEDGQNRLTLIVSGCQTEARRIAKVMNVTPLQILMGSTLPVKFSRITVMVTFQKASLAKAA